MRCIFPCIRLKNWAELNEIPGTDAWRVVQAYNQSMFDFCVVGVNTGWQAWHLLIFSHLRNKKSEGISEMSNSVGVARATPGCAVLGIEVGISCIYGMCSSSLAQLLSVFLPTLCPESLSRFLWTFCPCSDSCPQEDLNLEINSNCFLLIATKAFSLNVLLPLPLIWGLDSTMHRLSVTSYFLYRLQGWGLHRVNKGCPWRSQESRTSL